MYDGFQSSATSYFWYLEIMKKCNYNYAPSYYWSLESQTYYYKDLFIEEIVNVPIAGYMVVSPFVLL